MHDKHRERLRKKYLKVGADGLEKHELLELYLFYSIPRRNTNDIAHNLINKFGSLSGVLDAPFNIIKQVDGIGEKSAILIKLWSDLYRIYLEDKNSVKSKKMTNEIISEMIKVKFIGRNNENVALILLNSKMELLFFDIIKEGSFNSVMINCEDFIKKSISYNCAYAIVAHNHPSGKAYPSSADIEMTIKLRNAFELINVKLIDHFIVTDNDCVSLFETDLREDLFGIK